MTDPTSQPTQNADDPIDAEFEPAATPSKLETIRKGPGWRSFGVVGVLFLVSSGLILANYGLIPGLPVRGAPASEQQQEAPQTSAELQTALDALSTLQGSIADNQAELRRLNSNIQSLSNTLDTLREDVDALETRQPPPSSDPGQGDNTVTPVNPLILDRLEALETSLTQFPGPGTSVQGETTRMQSDLAELRDEIEALNAQLNAQAAEPVEPDLIEVNRAEAALALSAIEAAARRGRPFLSGYQRLAAAMPDERAVADLSALAATGAPTLASLSDQFPALQAQALDVDAEAMGDAAGWMRGVFGDSLKVRRDGEISAAELLQAANMALQAGKLDDCVAEIEKLQPGTRAVFTDWLELARNRLSLEEALDALRLAMIARARP